MIKLIQNGLFGHSLVQVSTESMIKRYNDCLKDIGLAPTRLTSFHIDGWGWSPEIAEEQGDRFYLSHGLANPYGIIVSPKQANSSIYLPYHSFDRAIHKTIFEQYADQIKDITSRSGLWFELDQEISAYRSPQDLLMVDYVKLNFFSVDRIMTAAQDQRALIREFYDKPHAWSNDELRQRIIDSSERHGDLRYSKFEIPAHPFNEIENFFTVAFNGVYVFKKLPNGKPLLVHQSGDSSVSGETKHGHVEYNVNDPELISYLYNAGMISNNIKLFEEHPVLLELMQEHLLLEAASKLEEPVDFSTINATQKKGVVNRLMKQNLLGDAYFEFERLIMDVRDGSVGASYSIPDVLRPFLLNPEAKLSSQEKLVLWQLLCTYNPANPVFTYLFDKSSFYSQYKTWDEKLQLWIIQKILAHKEIFNALI
ncbi:MAG: hypothetical protein JJ975_01445 [Bacteroidia bacterium]|nr:hypothetical protein [Bacteroidia bacterium]